MGEMTASENDLSILLNMFTSLLPFSNRKICTLRMSHVVDVHPFIHHTFYCRIVECLERPHDDDSLLQPSNETCLLSTTYGQPNLSFAHHTVLPPRTCITIISTTTSNNFFPYAGIAKHEQPAAGSFSNSPHINSTSDVVVAVNWRTK